MLALATRLLAMAWARGSGFTAISDDDFARVVLAQRFTAAPRFDASQSSWLPFPIWWDGVSMLLVGQRVEALRRLYELWSLLGVVGCYIAGRWLGATRLAAALGALACAGLPHAVWLSMATVPDGYVAVLGLLAAASLHRERLELRWVGALAACAASLSRYEAWAIAAVVAGFNGVDAIRHRTAPSSSGSGPALWGCALLAAFAPCAWLIHGALNHGDALFFVQRVADYRRGIGESLPHVAAAFSGYPARLLTCEPELTLLALVTIAVRWRRARRFTRIAVAMTAILLLLVAGDMRDGAPTHHAGRPLLMLWLSMALVCAALLSTWYRERPGRASAATLTAVAAGFTLRLYLPAHEPFVDRESELAVGRALSELLVHERALVYTPHYGYLAIMAGSQHPDRFIAVNCTDPRQADLEPCHSPAHLQTHARAAAVRWWVMAATQARALGLQASAQQPPYAWGRFSVD